MSDRKESVFVIPPKPWLGYILILSDEPFGIDDIKAELNVATQNPDRKYVYQLIP